MNRESLQALIIDHQCGELSPEVAELLEAHLASDASSKAEAERILATLDTTRQAVLGHPELARTTYPEIGRLPGNTSRDRSWLARAAAILLLVSLAGLGGFRIGRAKDPSLSLAAMGRSEAPIKNSPWTRYRIASNPGGAGLQIARLENHGTYNTPIK